MEVTDEQLIALAKATNTLENIIAISKREDVPSMSYGYYQFDMKGSFLFGTTLMLQLIEAVKISSEILNHTFSLKDDVIKKLTPETRKIKAQTIEK